jgi:hypothetical protein|tara:strand:- start:287 stop:475 length:189 start_codon:yes stop_codon:yes gene_type:complete
MTTKKEITAELAQASKVIETTQEHLNDLYRYINSSKFTVDTTVQVSDISRRLDELKLSLMHI